MGGRGPLPAAPPRLHRGRRAGRFAAAALAVSALAGGLLVAGTATPPAGTAPVVPAATWSPLSPVTNPSAHLQSSMAYDPATGDVVLFGGSNAAGTALATTWI